MFNFGIIGICVFGTQYLDFAHHLLLEFYIIFFVLGLRLPSICHYWNLPGQTPLKRWYPTGEDMSIRVSSQQ